MTGEHNLADAIAAHSRFLEGAEGADERAFLARYPDLRDLLESMLRTEREDQDHPRSREPMADRLVGDYRLVRELGRGGMGVVFEAEQRSLGRHVALKMLSPALLLDPAAIVRFRREAALAASLDHPSITKVFGFDVTADRAYIAMQLVPGPSLAAVLCRLAAMSPERVDGETLAHAVRAEASASPGSTISAGNGRGIDRIVDWVIQVAEALHAAHERGVVHRDVKPGNILVRADDLRAVLTDFGLARETGALGVTGSGVFAGTLSYAAPEQVRGEVSRIGPRTDIFALGVTLYELLTFKRPFDADNDLETPLRIQRMEARNPRRDNPLVDRDLCAVLQRALEKEPPSRYPTALAFAEDLRRWRRREPVRARPVPWLQRCMRWGQRNPLASGFLGFAAVALVVVSWLAVRAGNQAQRANAALADFDDLAVGEQLAGVERRAAELIVRTSDAARLAELRAEGQALVGQLPRVQQVLAALRTRGRPRSAESQAHERLTHPLATRWRAIAAELDAAAELEASPDQETRERVRVTRRDRAAVMADELLHLEPQIAAYRGFVFASARDQLLYNRLEDVGLALLAFVAFGGKDLDDRASWASEMETRTIDSHRQAWDAAADAIAKDERYGGFHLRPQAGIVPLGPDPDTGLWEFAHLRSGARTVERDASTGRLTHHEDSCLVLVLIPAGRLAGIRVLLEDRPHHTGELRLAPFFLSKYEMSRHQWHWLTRYVPALRQITKRNLRGQEEKWRAPAIFVSWDQSDALLRREGLCLPTYAQWRWAAQTDRPDGWWNPQPGSEGVLADCAAIGRGGQGARKSGTDAVDANAANPFGLHNMIGNVWEWCADSLVDALPGEHPDGRCLSFLPVHVRCMAGCSYVEDPGAVTLEPDNAATSVRLWTTGLRPARAVDK